ncbi:MAG: hypothetical protein HXX10_08405 [Rhodoplanes sp.]|uniref:RAMP superfamily CRISPR-associated protein n=1 Tax=Rhodoplanes sp. TaxID=1968906 RepID=UPI00184ADC74|nr:RAMP superfamily CRISPR-associated protein [Rhodoplanes sp.]NVO14043.1 hypothetical protein [Rhodoplanes sp.]
MLIDRIEFDLRLVVEAPLTVGSGRLEAKEGGEEGSIAEVHRDADGRPSIPATTIKGALRARWTGDDTVAASLFGAILDRRAETGVAGSLLLYAASLGDTAGAVAPAKRARDDGTFDRPATAIDRDTGAAADNKLFAQRAVAKGAVFDLHGKFLCDLGTDTDGKSASDAALNRVAEALAPLSAGIAIGKGTRQGYGRLRLTGVTAVAMRRFGPQGYGPEPAEAQLKTAADDLQTRITAAAKTLPATTKRPAVTLEIHAPGPFLILDPSAEWSAKASTEGVETHVNVHYLAGPDGVPVLWPSSFLGALRSRAAWLLEIERMRRKDGSEYVPKTRGSNVPVDDRFLDAVFADRRAVLAPGDLRLLTPVERLFGVPGWRGLIEIVRLACVDRGQPRKRTSIAIDRLTGGGKDGALFTVEAVEGSRFEIDIAIDQARMTSGWQKDLAERDAAFFEVVIDDLVKNGLMLGHGAARGYGWFTVAKA